MPLLEVVQTVTTCDEALELGFEVGEKLGQDDGRRRKDKRGFIVNRLLVPYMLDAIRAYEEGVGSIEEIDAAMKAGASHPMGPLTLADFVGLDTLVSIGDVMFDEYRERPLRRSRRRCARWSPPAGTGASRARASTTTRARSRSPSRASVCQAGARGDRRPHGRRRRAGHVDGR